MKGRPEALEHIAGKTFDVYVIGGGDHGRGLTGASFALCAHAVTMSALHIRVRSAMRGTREPEPGANECGWSECYQGRLAAFIPLAE